MKVILGLDEASAPQPRKFIAKSEAHAKSVIVHEPLVFFDPEP
jgi:hypothetical protein